MTQIIIDPKAKPKNRLSQWLFNPFQFIAGFKALLIGLAIITIAGFVGSLSNTHFDGVLDTHTGQQAPLWFFLAEGLIDWLSLAVPLFIFALFISRSSLRIIDVFGTQALARWPALLTALAMYPPANQRITEYFMTQLTRTATETTISPVDVTTFIIAMIVTLLVIIWMIALMYRSYSVSCNVKGPKAVGTFIAALIIGEILSKVLIYIALYKSWLVIP